jgi:hypothetical protein
VTISKERKAVIHVGKAQLAMTDADYHTLLQRVAGVGSSSELDDGTFDKVMAEFERLGFRSAKHRTPAARREGMATPAQVGKIRALWKAYGGAYDEPGLERWLEVHLHASTLKFLDAWRAGKAIAILNKMVAGKRAKRAGDEGSPQAIGVKQ